MKPQIGKLSRYHAIVCTVKVDWGTRLKYIMLSSGPIVSISSHHLLLTTGSTRKLRAEFSLLASEGSERDTFRGVQIRACAVYIYIYIYIYTT